jgi:hypothetical protein
VLKACKTISEIQKKALLEKYNRQEK